ncbi:MAG: DegT/DnrJ/EryC1/StrS family aminotransferase, partial [Sphingobacteriaceae bacterium]
AQLIGLGLTRPIYNEKVVEYNGSYYPILFPNQEVLLNVKELLSKEDINTRRYFFPSLNNLPYLVHVDAPLSEDIASRVLCLPLFYELEHSQVVYICGVLKRALLDQI